MTFSIKLATNDVWLHDANSPNPLTVEKALEIAKSTPHETVIYKDDKPFMRHRPRNGGVSLIARERASH